MTSDTRLSNLSSDSPLHDPSDDRLHRQKFAEDLARSIRTIDPSNGFVFALTGPWGSGKTTVLNFVEHHLKGQTENKPDTTANLKEQTENEPETTVIVHFNPWWISGSDRLIEHFFKQFRFDLQNNQDEVFQTLPSLLDQLNEFEDILKPIPYIGIISRVIQLVTSQNQDLHTRRQKIHETLAQFSGRIVVFIDDLDRLRPDEIRLVFRLIKAVANFPRTIYVLAYDEPVVTRALGDEKSPTGREYLDKIVQLPLTLPAPGQSSLRRLFLKGWDEVFAKTPEHLLDRHQYDKLHETINRFLTTPRNVARLLNLLRATYPPVQGEVNAVDFVGIQALRLFVPAMHAFVANNKEAFCDEPEKHSSPQNEENVESERKYLEEAIKTALRRDWGEEQLTVQETVRSILVKLFPRLASLSPGFDARQFFQRNVRENCRVCSAEVFDRYFFLGTPSGDISEVEYRAILSLLPDAKAFGNKLKQLVSQTPQGDINRARLFWERIESAEQVIIPNEHIEPFLRALYFVGGDLSIESDEQIFPGPLMHKLIERLTTNILAQLPTQEERLEILDRVFQKARALFAMAWYINGLREERSQTIETANVRSLERSATDRIRVAANEGWLQNVPQLGSILYQYAKWATEDEVKQYVARLIEDDKGLCNYITGFCSAKILGFRDPWIELSHVGHFLDDEPGVLLPRVNRIIADSPEWLTNWHQMALDLFIQAINRSKNNPDESVQSEQ